MILYSSNIRLDRCQKIILGNHDQAALFDPDGFNVGAERAIRWTRDQLESHDQRVRRPELRAGWHGELSHADGQRGATT